MHNIPQSTDMKRRQPRSSWSSSRSISPSSRFRPFRDTKGKSAATCRTAWNSAAMMSTPSRLRDLEAMTTGTTSSHTWATVIKTAAQDASPELQVGFSGAWGPVALDYDGEGRCDTAATTNDLVLFTNPGSQEWKPLCSATAPMSLFSGEITEDTCTGLVASLSPIRTTGISMSRT